MAMAENYLNDLKKWQKGLATDFTHLGRLNNYHTEEIKVINQKIQSEESTEEEKSELKKQLDEITKIRSQVQLEKRKILILMKNLKFVSLRGRINFMIDIFEDFSEIDDYLINKEGEM